MGPDAGWPPEDTSAGTPPLSGARDTSVRHGVGRSRPWLWLVAAIAFVLLAGAGGVAVALLVARWNAVPPPTAVVTPAPPRVTPSPSPTLSAPSAGATPSASAQPSAAVATPAPSAVVHVVAAGENLTVIARRYGVTVADIVAANGITDPNQIAVGQRLSIPVPARSPSGSPPASPTSGSPTPTGSG